MISIKVDRNEIDFSKVEVGYRMDLSGTYEGEPIIMKNAIIKKVDVDNNEITVETSVKTPVDKSENQFLGFFNDLDSPVDCGMKFIDKDGNVLIDNIH
jgi:hypothetical protein